MVKLSIAIGHTMQIYNCLNCFTVIILLCAQAYGLIIFWAVLFLETKIFVFKIHRGLFAQT